MLRIIKSAGGVGLLGVMLMLRVGWFACRASLKISFFVTILFFSLLFSAFAEGNVHSFKTDSRAKMVAFDPHQVYRIQTHYLVSTDIIFAEDEVISYEGIHLGDVSAWDISFYRHHLYIKAKGVNATGNLSVTTNMRTYHFVLSVSDAPLDSEEQTFFIKFIYPKQAKSQRRLALQLANVPRDICQNKRRYNLKYSYTGNSEQAPIRACDDGIFTYFKFNRQIELPAIFYVLPNRKESVVNYRIENDYVVVERIGKAFTLRNGDVVTSVYNDKYIGDWDKVK